MRQLRMFHTCKCYLSPVSHDVEPVRMYIGSSCHTPLAQKDEVVRPNPKIVTVFYRAPSTITNGNVTYCSPLISQLRRLPRETMSLPVFEVCVCQK